MSAPARNTREVRRRPRRAAALSRRRESLRRDCRIAEEIRAQFVAMGRTPTPRPVGRDSLRCWASDWGISARVILPELIRPKDAAYPDQAPKDAESDTRPPRQVLDHLVTAPRTGPPAAAVADCTGGAVSYP